MSLWQGQKISQIAFWSEFDLVLHKKEFWTRPVLSNEILFSSLEKISNLIRQKKSFYQDLKNDLLQNKLVSEDQLDSTFQQLLDFISTSHLHKKLLRELGSEFPFELKRLNPKEDHFESWYPMGTLIHITPNNSPLLNVLAMVEGLLSGNVNVLKLGRKDSYFAEIFFAQLCDVDPSKTLKNYVFVTSINTRSSEEVKKFLSIADVISAWGGEESLDSIKKLAPAEARIVEWGHKISLAYLTKSAFDDLVVQENIAREICWNDQQSCSSPQVLYLETSDLPFLKEWALQFSLILEKVSHEIAPSTPTIDDQAEISIQSELVRLNEVLDKSFLISNKNWRIFVDYNSVLRGSPLFRTIWIKPIQRENVVSVFSSFKKYLQTVGLAGNQKDIFELTPLFFQSGFLRIKPLGQMTDSYMGEPHDGQYALQRFCKKVSLTNSRELQGFMEL